MGREFDLNTVDMKIELYDKDYDEFIEIYAPPPTKSKLNIKLEERSEGIDLVAEKEDENLGTTSSAASSNTPPSRR